MAISTINAASTGSTGTVMVSGNMPAFNVYLGADQSVTSGVSTKVAYDTKVFDTANCFNTSTNRFTPNVAGYYQVSAGIDGTNSAGSQTRFLFNFTKNGTGFCHAVDFSGSNAYTISGSTLVYCNGTTDYIEVYAMLSASGPKFTGGYSGIYTWFSGALIRSA